MAHLFDVTRREQSVATDDHARQTRARMVASAQLQMAPRPGLLYEEFVFAMTRQVQNPPGAAVQGVNDHFCTGVDTVGYRVTR